MKLRTVLIASLLLVAVRAEAQQPSWSEFLDGVFRQGLEEGIRESTLVAALDGLQPLEKAIEKDRSQPERTITFQEYLDSRVPDSLIETARHHLRRHEPLLTAIGDHYGVEPVAVVALWGLETRFGGFTGDFDVIAALATLAWDPRRAAFFRKELMQALRILDEGHIARDDMTGSWAGAMGESQFMPTSFATYAVDWDLDGHKDIWNNRGDVFASSANFLASSGWRAGMPWGAPVTLPPGFDRSLASNRDTRPLSAWLAMGAAFVGAAPEIGDGEPTSLVMPAGGDGPAWLVFDNYRTILIWNRSDFFAMSVFILVDALSVR